MRQSQEVQRLPFGYARGNLGLAVEAPRRRHHYM
jgi:hypothetical protein